MDNNKQDNNKFIDEFLTISSNNSSDPKALLENSKVFYEKLMAKTQELLENKDFEALQELFKSISTKLKKEFENIGKQYGISQEEIQKMMNNPMNIPKDFLSLGEEVKKEEDKKEKKVNKIKKNWTPV